MVLLPGLIVVTEAAWNPQLGAAKANTTRATRIVMVDLCIVSIVYRRRRRIFALGKELTFVDWTRKIGGWSSADDFNLKFTLISTCSP